MMGTAALPSSPTTSVAATPRVANGFGPDLNSADAGAAMYRLITELYPICRSITGDGFRQTLELINLHVPLTVQEVPSGMKVFDWTVPNEWNIKDAYIKNRSGKRLVDLRNSTLHVVSYSTPIHALMRLSELRPHLHSLPDRPYWIPYRTSYYTENWGFCLAHNELLGLTDQTYEVLIDSSLEPGFLTYGECLLSGRSSDEILISCHACHPSLCNDNLSGIAVAIGLAQTLSKRQTRYSYRFLFVPGTIGSIVWLARNQLHVSRIKHGMVLTCLGDAGGSTYKKSRRGDAEIDRAFNYVLRQTGQNFEIEDFFPWGYDERQYCSPGFDLPVGCFMRTPHGRFDQYHTSADDLTFVHPESLQDSLAKCLAVVDVLEENNCYISRNPCCEPQLGRRGVYDSIGGNADIDQQKLALLWVLNLSDGKHALLDIAERSNLPWRAVKRAVEVLSANGLLAGANEGMLVRAPAPDPGHVA